MIQLYKKSFEGLQAQVWYMGLMMLVNRMGSLILPFLTLYTTQHLGWSIVDSGIASSCFGIGSMLGALLGGWLVDKFGYYKVIIAGQFGAAFSFFSLQYFTSFYPLCVALFFSSLVSDILRPGVMTGVSMISSEATKTRAISLMRMAFNLGMAIGPAFAGLIILYTSYKSIFIIDAITCFVAAIFGLVFLQKDHPVKKEVIASTLAETKVRSPYQDKAFMLFMFWTLLMLIAFFQLLFTFPLFMKEVLLLKETDVGIFFAINGLLIFVSEMPIVYFTEKKWRLMPAMILGSIMIGVSFLMLLIPTSAWLIVIAFAVLISYGEIINFPFITSLSLRRTKDENVGQYMGIVSMLFSLAIIISPIIGTNLIEHFGYNVTWIVCFLICMIAAFGWSRLDDDFKKVE